MLTRQTVMKHLADCLNNKLSLAALGDWAEKAIEEKYAKAIMQSLGRIAAADVKEFGLLWEDCENIAGQLGFTIKVDIEKAA